MNIRKGMLADNFHFLTWKMMLALFGRFQEETKATTVSYQQTGPGEVNVWKLLQDNENCWLQHQEQSQRLPHSIIISSPQLLDEDYPEPLYSQSLTTLICTGVPVILWQGAEKKPQEMPVCETMMNLVDARSTLVSATEESIKQALVQHFLDPNDYLIIDYINLNHLRNYIAEENHNLTRQPLWFPSSIQKGTNAEKLRYLSNVLGTRYAMEALPLMATTSDEVELFCSYFPKARTLIFENDAALRLLPETLDVLPEVNHLILGNRLKKTAEYWDSLDECEFGNITELTVEDPLFEKPFLDLSACTALKRLNYCDLQASRKIQTHSWPVSLTHLHIRSHICSLDPVIPDEDGNCLVKLTGEFIVIPDSINTFNLNCPNLKNILYRYRIESENSSNCEFAELVRPKFSETVSDLRRLNELRKNNKPFWKHLILKDIDFSDPLFKGFPEADSIWIVECKSISKALAKLPTELQHLHLSEHSEHKFDLTSSELEFRLKKTNIVSLHLDMETSKKIDFDGLDSIKLLYIHSQDPADIFIQSFDNLIALKIELPGGSEFESLIGHTPKLQQAHIGYSQKIRHPQDEETACVSSGFLPQFSEFKCWNSPNLYSLSLAANKSPQASPENPPLPCNLHEFRIGVSVNSADEPLAQAPWLAKTKGFEIDIRGLKKLKYLSFRCKRNTKILASGCTALDFSDFPVEFSFENQLEDEEMRARFQAARIKARSELTNGENYVDGLSINDTRGLFVSETNTGGSFQIPASDVSIVMLDNTGRPLNSMYFRSQVYSYLLTASSEMNYKIAGTIYQPVYDPQKKLNRTPVENSAAHYCTLEIDWQKDGCVTIPTTLEYQDIIYITSTAPFNERYNKTNNIWQIFPDASMLGKKQIITYRLAASYAPDKLLQTLPIRVGAKKDISQELESKFWQIVVLHPDLMFLLNEELHPLAKINRLMPYFHDFEDSTLKTPIANDIEKLMASFLEKKGVCLHISMIVMILCELIGVKASISTNRRHANVDLMYNYNGCMLRLCLPVSGFGRRQTSAYHFAAPQMALLNNTLSCNQDIGELDASQKELMVKDFIQRHPIQAETALHDIAALTAMTDPVLRDSLEKRYIILRQKLLKEKPDYLQYRQQFNLFAASHTLTSCEEAYTAAAPMPLLIRTHQTQNIDQIALHLESSYLQKGNACLYVSDANELEAFFRSKRLTTSELLEIEGPLASLIQNPYGLLIINLSDFGKKSLQLLSLIDTEQRSLFGLPVHQELRIILMAPSSLDLCQAFNSRCRHFIVAEDFAAAAKQQADRNNPDRADQEALPVECYQDDNWQTHVLGTVHFHQGQPKLMSAPLYTASRDKKILMVDHAPESTDWQRLTLRAKMTSRLYFNGEWIEAPHITVTKSNIAPFNMAITMVDTDEISDFIVNTQTYSQLFTCQVTNEDGLMDSHSGLLHYAVVRRLLFSDALPPSVLLRMMAHLLHNQAALSIGLLPGGEFGGSRNLQETALVETQTPQNGVVICEDLDNNAAQLRRQLQKEDRKVKTIYVNPLTTYQTLIASIQIKKQAATHYRFIFQRTQLLQELIAGTDILLVGEISKSLFLQIQSAFASKPHFWIEGQRIEFAGRLFLLTPNSKNLPAYPPRQKYMSTEDNLAPFKRKRAMPPLEDAFDLPSILLDHSSPLIVLKGEPGCGKTHLARQLRNHPEFSFFEGREQILACLLSQATNRVLFLDEIDTAAPGTFDFLHGLIDGTNEVYFNDAWHPVKPHSLTVLGTMNGQNHIGRYTHNIIEKHAFVIPMASPSTEFCENLLAGFFDDHKQIPLLVSIYAKAREMAPVVGFSLRDLKAFAHRVKSGESILEAATAQFAYSIANDKQRQLWLDSLHALLAIDVPTSSTATLIQEFNKFVITSSRMSFMQLIHKNCFLRFRGADIKWHILCEGNSGTSKSSSFLFMMQQLGYTENHPEASKRFYRINANASNFREIALKAAREGTILIIEELNTINEVDQQLLSALLDGYHPIDNCNVSIGFVTFASQNSSANHADRQTTSQPLSSRFHRIYLNDYIDEELIAIAAQKGIRSAPELVAAFRECEKQHPSVVNTRTFFTVCESAASSLQDINRPRCG